MKHLEKEKKKRKMRKCLLGACNDFCCTPEARQGEASITQAVMSGGSAERI